MLFAFFRSMDHIRPRTLTDGRAKCSINAFVVAFDARPRNSGEHRWT